MSKREFQYSKQRLSEIRAAAADDDGEERVIVICNKAMFQWVKVPGERKSHADRESEGKG